ncbi:MAG TPA: ankyrin repeat domain-containing protein [Vicinamibacterales bacterium]|jgi:ankyrin repeat protein|nr:ankyrin repeat domain-containing protein [Vicinamibacterales bacterium]
MIKPFELQSGDGRGTWDTIVAASTGDVATLRRLLQHDPRLARAEYWYAPAVHFAAREGHADAVRLLLHSGADPEQNGLHDRNLIEMARERGHEPIARMLEQERERRGRVAAQSADHLIHRAAALGEIDVVRTFLDADATLVNRGARRGVTPLHCAVVGGSREVVTLLLDRGANIHARNPDDLQAIDFGIWGERRPSVNDDMVRLLVSRGATYDLTIAAALGDLAGVRHMLDDAPSRISETRPNRRRPLSAAVEFGRDEIARLLLERGANPRWEPAEAVHSAARRGNFAMVKLLLDHGADPNEDIDSTSNAVAFAATPEIRALLEAHGGDLGAYDTSWIEHDDDRLRQMAMAPPDEFRIGAAFTMSAERPDLLARLLDAGLRMPAVHTSCQGYLNRPDALRMLLAHGMSPDQMNWQHQTLLHHAATQDTTDCAAILLDAGATMTARDDEYRSTPLAWAARANTATMVEFLLSRGAPVALLDDEPWATALAWAERRGHQPIASMLRARGATR